MTSAAEYAVVIVLTDGSLIEPFMFHAGRVLFSRNALSRMTIRDRIMEWNAGALAGIASEASGTSLTGLSGVGPVVAAIVTGGVRDAWRFPDRDHFTAYDGTAPIEVSCGAGLYLPEAIVGDAKQQPVLRTAPGFVR